jgi:glycosyltransferase involved in cell wall biosynthesis
VDSCDMHICYLCNEYPPSPHGGIGSFTQTLAQALVKRGHQVSVVGAYAQDVEDHYNDMGVAVYRVPTGHIRGTRMILTAVRLSRTVGKIHSHSPVDILEGPELSFGLLNVNSPCVRLIRMNGGHHFFSITLGKKLRPVRSWLERRSFNHVNNLCAVSNYVAETTRNILRLGDRPIEILPNPVDISQFQPSSEVKETTGLILFVGTVVEKKGIRELILAFPEILKKFPGARLWVIGRDWRNPETGQSTVALLRDLIPDEVKPAIEFRGPVEHSRLPELLSQAQICAYPSHMESQGIVVIEGMAMGKAVVASQTGPGPEIIEHGVSGLLCNPFKPESIAEQIILALTDDQLRRRLGQEARKQATERFSIDTLVVRNEAFYERILH